jgi:transcriptional regulator with XRE-family HTH domain
MFSMDPETQRLINLLKVSFRILGVSNREIARRMEMSPSYVSKLLSGSSELRLDHLVRMCRAADIEPAEFFSLAYPRGPVGATPAMAKLRELLGGIPLSPTPAKAQDGINEEQIEQMLKATLARMMGQGGGA